MSKKIKKQRVIFFLPVFTSGGASESIVKLSKFLNDKGYSISLISIGLPPDDILLYRIKK